MLDLLNVCYCRVKWITFIVFLTLGQMVKFKKMLTDRRTDGHHEYMCTHKSQQTKVSLFHIFIMFKILPAFKVMYS